jgi:hypothetical protein
MSHVTFISNKDQKSVLEEIGFLSDIVDDLDLLIKLGIEINEN